MTGRMPTSRGSSRPATTINATYLGSNDEIFANLRAGGLGTIDLVTPYHGYVKNLYEAGSAAGDRLLATAEHGGLHSSLPEAGVEHLRRQDLLRPLRLGHRANDLQRRVHPRGARRVDGRHEARVHGQGRHDR